MDKHWKRFPVRCRSLAKEAEFSNPPAFLTSPKDQKIISALASGECTKIVAQRFGISPARVSQLRRRYRVTGKEALVFRGFRFTGATLLLILITWALTYAVMTSTSSVYTYFHPIHPISLPTTSPTK
jgi:Helix-turn-helix domain